MMISEALYPHLFVLRGRVVDADYCSDQLSIYQDNPLIEALPPLLNEDAVFMAMQQLPRYDASERLLPSYERLHLVQEVMQFFQPLPVHLDLEQRFARLIRSGYRARNPITPQFWRDLPQQVNALRQEQSNPVRLRSTAAGFTMIGMSGVGKTTAVEEILQLYPQVINHGYYREQHFTLRQIVWLKLDCPFDGSIKGLCLNFFQAVDDLLETEYYRNYGYKGRRTVDELIPAMARVASLHCLGVLVIDELQNLSEAKSGGHKKMLNFFVGLINTIGLPVVLVGTYKAWSVLSGEFRQMRRGTGQGDLIWHPMKEDETWQFFLESLWRYQYVRTPSPLTAQLSHTLFTETQGITDLAIKVYMLAQIRAIVSGKETVTTAIIRSVAKDCLGLAASVLSALKRRDKIELQKYEDVVPLQVESYVQEAQSQLHSTVVEDSTAATDEQAVSETTATVPRQSPSSPSGLLKVFTTRPRRMTAYKALQQAGYIRSATEYLGEKN